MNIKAKTAHYPVGCVEFGLLSIVLASIAATTQPSTKASGSKLASCWEPVPIYVVSAQGETPKEVSILKYTNEDGRHGPVIRDAMLAAVRDVPEKDLPLFLEAVSVRFKVSTGAVPDVSMQFVYDVWDAELFAAEVRYYHERLRGEAYMFNKYPPLQEESRQKAVNQIHEYIAAIKDVCSRSGYDSSTVDQVIAMYNQVFQAHNHRGCYGALLVPIEDDRYMALKTEAGSALADKASSLQGDVEAQKKLVTQQMSSLFKMVRQMPEDLCPPDMMEKYLATRRIVDHLKWKIEAQSKGSEGNKTSATRPVSTPGK